MKDELKKGRIKVRGPSEVIRRCMTSRGREPPCQKKKTTILRKKTPKGGRSRKLESYGRKYRTRGRALPIDWRNTTTLIISKKRRDRGYEGSRCVRG